MAENAFEDTIAENFPNLGKETDIQVHEVQRVPNKINPKRSTPSHSVIRQKLKIENIKSSKGKVTRYIQRNSYKTVS